LTEFIDSATGAVFAAVLPPDRGVKSAAFGADSVFQSGAPRPMKMGTIASPWRYDAAA